MKLFSLLGNHQQLDGGAMFGNAPRFLWSRWLPPDANNCIRLACRCLLIQDNNKNILLEAGIGAFFEPKLKERYGIVEESHHLLTSLAELGLTHEDIHYVILSHLHFDHAGGLLSAWEPGKPNELLFPNATFLVSQEAWERANNPHPRDKASFIPPLNKLLADSKRLEIVDGKKNIYPALPNLSFHYSHGHTPGMMLTEIKTKEGPLIFAADLIPGIAWVHLPITMGYDRYPEKVINEKLDLLNYLTQHSGRLFFTHDPHVATAKIIRDEKNNFIPTEEIHHLSETKPSP